MIRCVGPFPRARTAAATGAGPQSRQRMNHHRKPRLGLERQREWPFDQRLKPPRSSATAPSCGVPRHTMVGTRRECPGETGKFSYESGQETQRVC